jgi:arabinofuranosyltransferase
MQLPSSTHQACNAVPGPEPPREASATTHTIGLAAILLALCAFAYANRFIQDDAYISFRYAQHLAEGSGLVWNYGERLEGYTNFLWTLLIAAGIRLGCDPADTAIVLGLCSFAATLLLTYAVGRTVLRSRITALLAVITLGTNYTFSAYATGGLETQFQTMLIMAAIFTALPFLERSPLAFPVKRAALLSGLCVLLLLTRLDSALVIAPLLALTIFNILRDREERFSLLGALCIPLSCALALWFAWKLSYYGDILPNTFYAKASPPIPLGRGVAFLRLFLDTYVLWPYLALAVITGRKLVASLNLRILFLALFIALWLAYIVRIGGDFMEFRLFVPMLPPLAILLGWVIAAVSEKTLVRGALAGGIIAGSFIHMTAFQFNPAERVEPVSQLQAHLTDPRENWVGIGKALGRAFDRQSRVVIATTAAGAIPYYSALPCVDMLGINDQWVTQNGMLISTIPGHQRFAPIRYLKERKVNLIISHPLVLPKNDPARALPFLPQVSRSDLSGCSVVEIPIDSTHKCIALYLTPSAIVDSVIRKLGWTFHATEENALAGK